MTQGSDIPAQTITVNVGWTREDQATAGGRELVVPLDTWMRALTTHARRDQKERDTRPEPERRPLVYTLARFSTEPCTCGQDDPPCPDLHWQPGQPISGHRLARNVIAVTGLAIDADKDHEGNPLTPASAEQILTDFAAKGIRAAIATTHSSTPDEPHYRVFVPFDVEVPIADWARFLPAALALVGIPPGCHADARHIWYFPSAKEGAHTESVILDGALLDTRAILATAPAVTPNSTSPRYSEPIYCDMPEEEGRLEAIRILAPALPPGGGGRKRPDCRMALAGALAREGWEQDDIVEFLDAVIQECDGNVTNLITSAHRRMASRAVHGVLNDEHVRGWTALAAVSPELAEAVPLVRRALNATYQTPAEREAKSAELRELFDADWCRPGAAAIETPPPPPPPNVTRPPTDTEFAAALRAASRKRSSDGAMETDVEHLKRILDDGQPYADDREFLQAAVAVARHAPPGSTPEQITGVLRNHAGGNLIARVADVAVWAIGRVTAENTKDAELQGYAAIAENYVATHRTHRDGPTIRRYQDSYYVWTDTKGHYVEFTKDEAHRDMYRLMRCNDDKEATKIVNALVGVHNVLVSGARVDRWLDGRGTDPLDMVVCRNGILNLVTGELAPPSPAFFSLASMGVSYDPSAPVPERWLRFLDEIFPDEQIDPAYPSDGVYPGQQKIDCLQEIMGYLLTPDTRQDKLFYLIGPTRSGKGTIFRILNLLFGSAREEQGVGYVCSPSLKQLGETFGRETLIGKSVAVIGDAKLSAKADATQILSELLGISGRDWQSINRKNEKYWNGYLSTRFVLGANGAPVFADPSGALNGRLIMLRFRRSFLGRENRNLTAELAEELPGILNWCIEGWRRLRERGKLVQPDDGKQDLEDLQNQGSTVVAWVRECCVADPGQRVLTETAREAYSGWCRRRGVTDAACLNSIAFGREMSEAGYPKQRLRTETGPGDGAPSIVAAAGTAEAPASRQYYYCGLRLRS